MHKIETCLVLLQNQEIEELTKICDELIAKMGKIDWVWKSLDRPCSDAPCMLPDTHSSRTVPRYISARVDITVTSVSCVWPEPYMVITCDHCGLLAFWSPWEVWIVCPLCRWTSTLLQLQVDSQQLRCGRGLFWSYISAYTLDYEGKVFNSKSQSVKCIFVPTLHRLYPQRVELGETLQIWMCSRFGGKTAQEGGDEDCTGAPRGLVLLGTNTEAAANGFQHLPQLVSTTTLLGFRMIEKAEQ